jgi:IMP-specific 5'-nucleotidase
MLQHSFVLDALETTAADTFLHFEVLIEELRRLEDPSLHHDLSSTSGNTSRPNLSHRRSMSNLDAPFQQSRLRQLVPTIGSFHTALPLREAFEIYNEKHRLVRVRIFVFLVHRR